MRLYEILDEKWDRKVKTNYSKTTFDVFLNPSKSEILLDLCRGKNRFRWVADIGNKNFYAFDSELLHKFVMNDLGVGKYLYGLAIVEGGECIQYGIENIDCNFCSYDQLESVIMNNEWLSRYIEFRDIQ